MAFMCCTDDCLLLQGAVFDLKNPADSSAFHAALDRGAAAVASKLLQYLNSAKPTKGSKAALALPAPSSSGNLSGSGALVPATKVWADVPAVFEELMQVAHEASSICPASCSRHCCILGLYHWYAQRPYHTALPLVMDDY
jgi:hypothetical protein